MKQTITLSARLAALSKYVRQGEILADIGTDHAYLPIYLVQRGICPRALAADINAKPLESARKNIQHYGLSDRIELRLGDGLQVLKPNEVQVVNIAGMGGGTITNILKAAPEVLAGLERLILQPMGDEEILRHWLLTNGWRLVDEDLVLEERRLYTIIVCEPGLEPLYDDVTLEIGPRLLEKRHPLLPKLIARLRDKYQLILTGLAKGDREKTEAKRQKISKHLRLLEEVADQLGYQ